MSRRARRPGDYDWSRAPRELLERLAAESVVYWHTPGPGPKPLATELCRTLDQLCEDARRPRPRREIDAEIANLCRDRSAMPRPIDLDEVSRINRRIELLCREPSAESDDSAAGEASAECKRLRATLTNIYHLTLNYGDEPIGALLAVREAAGPGTPEPCACWATRSCRYPTCPRIPPPPPLGRAPADLFEAEDA